MLLEWIEQPFMRFHTLYGNGRVKVGKRTARKTYGAIHERSEGFVPVLYTDTGDKILASEKTLEAAKNVLEGFSK